MEKWRTKRIGLTVSGGTTLCALFPAKAWAHGTQDATGFGMSTNIILLLVWALMLVFFIWMYRRGKGEQTSGEARGSNRGKLWLWGMAVALIGLMTSVSVFLMHTDDDESKRSQLAMMHIHGLGFTPDGERLIIPSHHGLTVFEDGVWREGEGEPHDFMGFAAVDDGFFSSGHPVPGSGYKEPFGIIKASGDGTEISVLDLHGEVDFHEMSAGYFNHAIYVVAHEPNTRMASAGLYYTLDKTKKWVRSEANGLVGGVFTMAVHPSDASMVVIGNQNGAFLSVDYGERFTRLAIELQVTSVAYTNNGELFIAGIQPNEEQQMKAVLSRVQLQEKEAVRITEIELPALNGDSIQYIAEHPNRSGETVFSTFMKNIYISFDKGGTWQQIADRGLGINEEHQ